MNFIALLEHRNTPLFYFGLACFITALTFLICTQIFTTEVKGVNAWFKPFKFAASTFFYAWAMGWFCASLPGFDPTLLNWLVIGLLGFEIVYISIQAARGQASHFNQTSPFYAAMFTLMGLAAAIVSLFTGYIAVLFFLAEPTDFPIAYLWAVRWGLVLFVVFSFEGAAMGARMAHTVGAADGSEGLPLLNWSKTHGDLRVAHFIGMHALQVLPFLAFYLIPNTVGVFVISILYGLLAVLTLVQALRGRPLLRVSV